jgi:hypothetical protein
MYGAGGMSYLMEIAHKGKKSEGILTNIWYAMGLATSQDLIHICIETM